MDKKLKLYVWEGKDVLVDWGTGLVCVAAYNKKEAMKMVEKEVGLNNMPEDLSGSCYTCRSPELFYCNGSS